MIGRAMHQGGATHPPHDGSSQKWPDAGNSDPVFALVLASATR